MQFVDRCYFYDNIFTFVKSLLKKFFCFFFIIELNAYKKIVKLLFLYKN